MIKAVSKRDNRSGYLKLSIGLKKILFVIFLLSLQYSIFSQNYQIQINTIVDKSGNPPSATFAILQDLEGFIWFGTIDGLYRFDGFNYKIFRNEPGNPNTLSNNTIRDLAIDEEGIIWIATQGGGLSAFNPQTEDFKNYKHTGNNQNELRGNSVWSVLVDSKGDIWAGITGHGVDRLQKTTGKITSYTVLEDNKVLNQEQSIRSMDEDEDGKIWVGISDDGVSSVDPISGSVKNYFYAPNNSQGISNDMPFDLHIGHDKNLWITTFGGGVNILNRQTEEISHIRYSNTGESIISDLTYSVEERVPGEYWIATEYGISVFNSSSGNIKNFQQNNRSGESISENRTREIFIDNKGIVWVGTESGVEQFITQSNFKIYSNYFGNTDGFNKEIVKAIATDKDYLWIGLIDNGLVRYSFSDKSSNIYYSTLTSDNNYTGNNINSILCARDGSVWIGDWHAGIAQYNAKYDRFEMVSNAYFETDRLSDNRVQKMIEGRKGILWIGTEGGLNRYNIKEDSFIRYVHSDEDLNSLSSNSLQSQALVFDKDSNLWLGTWSFGLNKMEFTDSARTKANFKHYKNDPENTNSLPNNNVISLLYDTTYLWIGTFGGGLCKLNLETEEFTNYTTEDGLPNNIIFAINKDKNGNLWLSTDYGISMFNPENLTFINYTKQDGLQDNHFFWGASYADENGTFYFGGINGLNSFVPEKVRPDTTPAKPVIVDITLFNNPVSHNRLTEQKDEVTFFYYENFISFEFAALDYSEPGMNMYKYILEGFDKDWVSSDNNNYASYTNLPPGKYKFMLQVSNSDGSWNEEILELKVTIIPPWWKTWIARLSFILIVTGAILGIYKLRFGILKRQKRNLEEQVKNRTLEIADKNKALNKQKEEITTQNEKLNEQKDELAERNEKLKKTLHELENTQKALVESEKLASLGILTAGVAHEINNPLNFISVSIENIKATISEFEAKACGIDEDKLDELNELINHSETGVGRISKIISGLKSFINNSDEEFEIFSPEEIINSALTVLAHKIPEYIKVNLKTNSKKMINARKFRLSQVFINILDNALDSINSKEKRFEETIDITIDTERHNNTECIKYRITNSGPPIPEDQLSKIFDPFFTTKQPNKGTGLGLYITYSIINEHKGYISVNNVKGRVVFHIFVPIHNEKY